MGPGPAFRDAAPAPLIIPRIFFTVFVWCLCRSLGRPGTAKSAPFATTKRWPHIGDGSGAKLSLTDVMIAESGSPAVCAPMNGVIGSAPPSRVRS